MKKFKTSLIYIAALLLITAFHFQLETLILKMSAGTFARYLIYGLLAAFFVVIIVKAVTAGKSFEIAIGLSAMGMVFFFLFSRSMFLFKLGILEFFILGLVVAWDGKRSRNYMPFLLIFGAACLVELTANLVTGTSFYYLDVWVLSLTALSGYIAGHLVN